MVLYMRSLSRLENGQGDHEPRGSGDADDGEMLDVVTSDPHVVPLSAVGSVPGGSPLGATRCCQLDYYIVSACAAPAQSGRSSPVLAENAASDPVRSPVSTRKSRSRRSVRRDSPP